MRRVLPLGVALGLALPLLAVSAPAGAATPATGFQISGASFFTIGRAPDGKVSHSQAKDDAYKKTYLGNTGALDTDNNQGVLGVLGGTSTNPTLTPTAPPLIALVADDKNSSWVLDGLAKDAKTLFLIHIYLFKLSDNPKKGLGFGNIFEQVADGTTYSADVTFSVDFPAAATTTPGGLGPLPGTRQ